MDVDQAATFLAGSILTALGFIVLIIGMVVVNNIIAKYWKPVKWTRYEFPSARFAEPHEIVEPTIERKKS